MMLLNCCIQYTSIFGRSYSFQSKTKAISENVHLPHIYTHLTCYQSNFSKQVFNSTGTVKFHMSKLDWEKAEEPEIKFPPSAGSQIKQENCRKTPTSASLNLQKPLTVWITMNCGKLRDWNTRPSYLPPEKSVCRSRSNSKNWTWNNRLVPNQESSMSRLYIVTLIT